MENINEIKAHIIQEFNKSIILFKKVKTKFNLTGISLDNIDDNNFKNGDQLFKLLDNLNEITLESAEIKFNIEYKEESTIAKNLEHIKEIGNLFNDYKVINWKLLQQNKENVKYSKKIQETELKVQEEIEKTQEIIKKLEFQLKSLSDENSNESSVLMKDFNSKMIKIYLYLKDIQIINESTLDVLVDCMKELDKDQSLNNNINNKNNSSNINHIAELNQLKLSLTKNFNQLDTKIKSKLKDIHDPNGLIGKELKLLEELKQLTQEEIQTNQILLETQKRCYSNKKSENIYINSLEDKENSKQKPYFVTIILLFTLFFSLILYYLKNYPKKFFATTKNIKVDCNACFNKDPTIGNICVLCKTINSPLKYVQHLDYFEIFNIEADFFIDKNKLDSQYKLIQKLIHPDKFSTKSEAELKDAEKTSSIINIAYSVLKDDYKRANYLLKLKGIKSLDEDSKISSDRIFLMNLLETQEQIEECCSREELMELKRKNDESLQGLKKTMEEAFRNNEYSEVAKNLKILKFYQTIDEHIENKLAPRH